MSLPRNFFAITVLTLAAISASAQATGVYTRAFDNARSGMNPNETALSQASVVAKGLIRQTTIPVIGDARGMEAQPLVMPQVKMKDGSVHDVLVLPSMANVVRGVDAESGAGLWQVTLGAPVSETANTTNIDMYNINQHWGCLSTGVIDPETKRWYGICQSSPDGTGDIATARESMYVLNIADGSNAVAPVMLSSVVNGVDFNSQWRKFRSSAVLIKQAGVKTIVQCGGSVFMTRPGTGGWCFPFDVATNTFGTPATTTQGQGANIWNSGQGISADSSGNLFALTATGNFDGVTNFGESLIKMTYANKALKIVDHWTNYQDQERTGQIAEPNPNLIAGANPATEPLVPVNGQMTTMAMKNARVTASINSQGHVVALVYPAMAQGAWADEDFGSAGPACIFSIGVCIASGKDGIAYPIKTTNLGGTTMADLQNPKANCAKLAAPPVWLTVDPGPVDPCPVDPETLNFFPWGVTAHLHMTPVQLYDPILKSWTIFAWGENQQLHKWAVSSTGALTYVAGSNEYASADVRNNPGGGMTGGFCSGSSNGADPNSMLMVCSIPYGNANTSVTNGRLLVYDPVHLAADGSLKVLWDSQAWGLAYIFNKFMPPVVWNGRVYLPNYNGGVEVFSLGQ